MAGVTKEQIEAAKQVDILDYLMRHEPRNLAKHGINGYRLRDHDSFVISNNKWYWFSRGYGCKTGTALNYLIKVRDYGFVDAVLALQGDAPFSCRAIPETAKPPPKSFYIPPRNADNKRVIAYLQSRGIDKSLILDCIDRGILFESAKYHNCVFTGKNEEGRTRFACLRSTTERFRRDIEGSDKRYGFLLPPDSSDSPNMACFEAPIDALSHQTMCKQGFMEWDGWRLSLSGGSLAALVYFLEHHPSVLNVFVCTDNDEPGQKIADKILALPGEDSRFAHIAVEAAPPIIGNDYNDTLQAVQRAERTQNRPRSEISI